MCTYVIIAVINCKEDMLFSLVSSPMPWFCSFLWISCFFFSLFATNIILCYLIISSTPPCQPNKVDLKCLSARPYIRSPSTKCFFNFSAIWCIGRGRRVTHDGMQYDPIQGQGHEPLKLGNSAIFEVYLLPNLQWGLGNDHGFLN